MRNISKKTDSPSSDSSSIKTPAILLERHPSPPRFIKNPRDYYEYTDDPPSLTLLLPLFDDEDGELKTNYPRFNLKPRVRTWNI
mmetsp:Transcript_583/g.1044  ORF Transcript_583/g.1044 Transcript_583/m.1044 type:complete len:84 (+) Transcript_583:249-500(+)